VSTALPPNSSTTKSTSSQPLASAIGSLTQLDAKQLWRPSAPGEVRDAWKKNDHAAAWKAWAAHLGKHKPSGLHLGKKTPAITWGTSAGVAAALGEWLAEGPLGKGQSAVAAAHRWVADSGEREADLVFALECVAWAAALPELAGKLGADAWWSLTETLYRVAQEAGATAAPELMDSETGSMDDDSESMDCEEVVVDQLLSGELPLLLSRQLSDLRPLQELAEGSKQSLTDGIERLTDGEGMLSAALWIEPRLHAASLLLACWTRCRSLSDSKPWSSDAQAQYEWLVQQSLRMSDRYGRLAFAPTDLAGADELLREGLRLGGDASDKAAASVRLKGYKADKSFQEPETSNHAEWAEIGILATGWRDKAPRMVVAHPSDTMRIEVHAGRDLLLSGEWPIDAKINGEAVRSTDDWECQCWHTDEDGDYLEVALPLVGGGRLERQFFLSRKDGVGFIAETLFSGIAEGARLETTARIPLGAGVKLQPEKETREAMLVSGDEAVAGLVPLDLAEWRDDPRGGELISTGDALVLTRQRQGRNAASFLWFDFSAPRFAKQRTWRQLTVAESLKNVTPDVAIGYRVQAAKQQWFIYRSLEKLGNRTLMGQNLSCEMLVGKYKAPEAVVEEYFQIEGPEIE
jgi:hypothetical protein